MASAADYETQMKAIQDQLAGYGSDLPSQINKNIQDAYTPALERSLNTTKNQMGDFTQRYFDSTSMGAGMGGTSAYDLSPTQKLGVMGRELGTMGGELQASSRFSDYLGGQMTDMYGKAMQAAEMGQRNLSSQYDRIAQQHQLQIQLQEAEKDRALQISLANRGTGGGWNFNRDDYIVETPQPTQEDLLREVQGVTSAIRSQRGKTGGVYTLGSYSGGINDIHKRIMENAKMSYNLNINPEWLWAELGNKTNMSHRALL